VEIRYTKPFLKDYSSLDPALQGLTDKALDLFAQNQRHPSLRVKKMQPHSRGIWEARVSRGFRFTFWPDRKSGILWLLRVGPHDILKTPI
jgi:mRNA-degrading endonuclease YafQ of YafQ-DinJ toxin-antitoxin module